MVTSIYIVPPLMGKTTLALDHAAGRVVSCDFDAIVDFDIKMFKSFAPLLREVDLARGLARLIDHMYGERTTLLLSNDYQLIDHMLESDPLGHGVGLKMVLPSVTKDAIMARAETRYSGNIPVNMLDAIDRVFRGGWERFAHAMGIEVTRAQFVADVV